MEGLGNFNYAISDFFSLSVDKDPKVPTAQMREACLPQPVIRGSLFKVALSS